MENQIKFFTEAVLAPVTPQAEHPMTGKVWDVSLIGALPDKSNVLVSGSKTYIRSANGRLYDTDTLAVSVPMWEGVKVYDNHLTAEEFDQRAGMRSAVDEWLGSIVEVFWDQQALKLKGKFKVVDADAAAKLLEAYHQNILDMVGLSIDISLPEEPTQKIQGMPVIDKIARVNSVDFVSEPAAGGAFERLIASKNTNSIMEDTMAEEKEVKQLPLDPADTGEETAQETTEAKGEKGDDLLGKISALIDQKLADMDKARKAKEADEAEADDEPVQEGEETEADESPITQAEREAEAVLKRLQQRERDLLLKEKIQESKLPEQFKTLVHDRFIGQTWKQADLDQMIKQTQEAYKAVDPSGQVKGAGGQRQTTVTMGLDPRDKAELGFLYWMARDSKFKALEHNQNDLVQGRLTESYRDWIKAGRPNIRYSRLSDWMYDWVGDPFFTGTEARMSEATGTSDVSSITKNAVNLLVAANYSVRRQWWAPIVSEEEVDTIDDATLVRTYGIDSLSVVNEGQTYPELSWSDDEETASFVKKGGYVGIPWEVFYKDKANSIRLIPQNLANSWFNTISKLVSGVFTVNSAAGPVLADSGALFNATAVSTGGGHANLLTTALSYSAYDAVVTAMEKQTDQALGAGERLLAYPRYLLVPVDLRATAQSIRDSEYVPAQSGGATENGQFQTVNQYGPMGGDYRPEVIQVPHWTDTNNWAAVADPQEFPAIWLIFLRGLRAPMIDVADNPTQGALFTNDEFRYKVRLTTFRYSATYDCAPVSDFRPLHKSNVT